MRSVWFAAVLALVSTGVAQCQSDGDLRLVGAFGNTAVSAGRVEFYYSGEWGTVCDDGFGQTEADTVCRQLGFSVATNYGNNLGFDSGSSFQRTWLDEVNCDSNDNNVFFDCTYNTIGVEDCSHSEDIMVVCSHSTQTNTQGDLRLVQNGITLSSFDEGRLEIFINGQWGTICDDLFGQTEADVACRQLGYRSASQYGNDLGFGFGSSSQQIWLDNVNCDSFDSRIIDCSHNSIGSNDCSHTEDVMVVCSDSTQTNTRGDLRLVQNGITLSSFDEGRLEIFINGQWGTICDDLFGQTEADVGCRQLGYSSASQYGNDLGFGFGSSSQQIWLDNVNCGSFDSRIIDCSHNSIGSNDCSHSEDIMVVCSDSTQTNTQGDLRLVQNGITLSSFDEGRLEIFINGQWGTICDNLFGQTEADVACRQLGYSSASQYGNDLGFGFGSSSQRIWLDNVNCGSFDSRIIDCSHNSIGSNNCGHSEDIMVNCGSFVNVAGVIIGCVIGGIVLIALCVVGFVVACVCCGVCAASSSTRSRRTAAAPAVAGYLPLRATVSTTATAQQANTAAAQFGAPAQQPPPASEYYASQPVQGYGNEAKQYPQAQLSSQEPPPPYDAVQQYPPSQEQQQPYPQDQAAAVVAPYPGAGGPAYPPAAGYPV